MGVVTGVSAGTVSISATPKNGGEPDWYTLTVYDSRGLVSGEEYYITNAVSGQLMGVDVGSNTDPDNIVLFDPITNDTNENIVTKRWRLSTYAAEPYKFNIINVASYWDEMLYVDSDNDVFLNDSTTSSRAAFEIKRISSGEYQGYYTLKCNRYYLCGINNPREVSVTTTLSNTCYWSISKVDKGNAKLFNFNYEFYNQDNEPDRFDTTAINNRFWQDFNQLGYTSSTSANNLPETVYSALTTSDIFVYAGSGGVNGELGFSPISSGFIKADASVATSGSGSSYLISNYSSNALASARCVIYFGSNTANNYEDSNGITHNILSETFNKGAHCVIGVDGNVEDEHINTWLNAFLLSMRDGNSIERAAIDATNAVSYVLIDGVYKMLPTVIVGDKAQRLDY